MALGGYYCCKDCGARRDTITPEEKLKDKESGKVYHRFEVVYDCGSRMVIHREGCNWKFVSFEHKCKPLGGSW